MFISVADLADRVDRLRNEGVEVVCASIMHEGSVNILSFEQFPECLVNCGFTVNVFEPDTLPPLNLEDYPDLLPF